MSTWRLTIVWSADTICDPTTIGSMPFHGLRAVRLAAAHDDLEHVRRRHAAAPDACASVSSPRWRTRGGRTPHRHADSRARPPSPSARRRPGALPPARLPRPAGKMNLTDPGRRSRTDVSTFAAASSDRHVGIVPARVHDADRLAVELADRLAGKRQFAFFAHRQAVHVGAQRDDRARACRPSAARRLRPGDARLRLEAEAAEPLRDVLRRLDFAVRQLGMLRGGSAASRAAQVRSSAANRSISACERGEAGRPLGVD